MLITILVAHCLLHTCRSQFIPSYKLQQLFEEVNREYVNQNSIAAELAWEASLDPGDPELPERAAVYQKNHIRWQQKVCAQLSKLTHSHLLNDTQRRQTYLLCRGPEFSFTEAREMSALYEELQSIYTDSKVCIPSSVHSSKHNMSAVESAILEYLSNVNDYVNSEKTHRGIDITMSYAVKIASKLESYDKNILCLTGEPDLEKLMSFSKNEQVLKWVWLVWREKVCPTMKEPYKNLIEVQNTAARRNGYSDAGAAWRDELEMPDLRQFCRRLYSKVEPLYRMLHGTIRFFLRKRYGDIIPEKGTIPAHLLGDLWSQNWESLIDLIAPQVLDLDASLQRVNWTVTQMVMTWAYPGFRVGCGRGLSIQTPPRGLLQEQEVVKHAEDFYLSLGLPPMTEQFWKNSVFSPSNNTRCHGTAADMYRRGDFRMLYCSGTTAKDLYVIHHEMGHIQYYMAYEDQPGIFRQGANSAFQESIGDAIMYGVLTSQHLYRIGLINDTLLFFGNDTTIKGLLDDGRDNEVEKAEEHDGSEAPNFSYNDIFLLKQALNKIPNIPFSLLIDEYRWRLFEGGIKEGEMNREFWKMASELQGIAPPSGGRSETYFDAGAKFHVPDNTPYIRYFLGSFLQVQLFESLCKATVFGHRTDDPLPKSMLLSQCDIYGSKTAGKILKNWCRKTKSASTSKLSLKVEHVSHLR
ncbi:Angiotensin-converting enzyme [Eumeta japonica]|uniref:Angiotensin-converting enzyme n=1 Tax=Eumeta variegata TaxID=151549 RepID=A0A4C1XC69_EUMVA|nr:Angiotensin-converting enzyme [Eumeta japonica]